LSVPGRIYTALLSRAQEQHGYVSPADARELGVNPTYLRVLALRGVLEHPARGVFRFPMTVVPPGRMDEYAAAVMWPQEITGVLTHDTTLDLYEICDINPDRIHITVPKRYRIKREVPGLYVIHHADLPEEDLTRHEGLAITTVRRTIADCIEAGVRSGLIGQAIDTAHRQAMLTTADAQALNEHARRQPRRA
jgi:predicted transcriptional regulator of viral defense system